MPRGLDAALRAADDYSRKKGYDVTVVMAGNNKDFPEEIRLLLDRGCGRRHRSIDLQSGLARL